MKAALRAALRLYPRWWRERYEREMTALLEDSNAGLPALLDIARGALVVRIKDVGRTMQPMTSFLGRNAMAFAIFWLAAFALMRAGQQIGGWLGAEGGVFVASVLGIVIAYKLRASIVAAYLGGLAGFSGSFFVIGPPEVITDRQSGTSLIEHSSVITAEYAQEIQLLRIVMAIVMATLVWQAVRRSTRLRAA